VRELLVPAFLFRKRCPRATERHYHAHALTTIQRPRCADKIACAKSPAYEASATQPLLSFYLGYMPVGAKDAASDQDPRAPLLILSEAEALSISVACGSCAVRVSAPADRTRRRTRSDRRPRPGAPDRRGRPTRNCRFR